MKNLTALQRNVINTLLYSLEHCFDEEDNGDFYSNENFICILTPEEYVTLKELIDTGI
jgi:hypothetical protein